MQRRDLLKGLALAGGMTAAVSPAVGAEATGASSLAGHAWLELAAAMAEAEQRYSVPPFGSVDPVEAADARRFMAETLQTALLFWADADPDRPSFTRFIGPHQKLLGDNPDSLYFFAPISPTGRYRIRGNVAGAAYTSFTVERGTGDGSTSKGLAATLNDTQFDVQPDGGYEIVVGGAPRPRNWLALSPDAGSLTTRHYFERERSAAEDPTLHIPLSIEPLDPLPPPPPAREAQVAANLSRATRFFRNVVLDMQPWDMPRKPQPFFSTVSNQFTPPESAASTRDTGFAARDNVYLTTRYSLGPDEALIMRGRFPRCRFANVALWNRHMQTYDYMNRRISLNRRQTKLEADGSFRMVVAHRDPGLPNWIDTEGRPQGFIFWRFLLPEGAIEPIRTEVVKLSSLGARQS
jgi:hypothetical protein